MTNEGIGEHAADTAQAEGMTGWDLRALQSLAWAPASIQLGDDGNGYRWYI